MMASVLVLLICLFSQIAVTLAFLVLSVRLIRESGQALTAVFLAFVFALWLLTDLYWLIYDLMRFESRMPFAANEIGEAAFFLMMAATLGSAVFCDFHFARWQAIGAILFAACNAALWIAWSGEWVQDIFIGAAFAYLLYMIACSLKMQRTLARGEWIAVGCFCLLLVLAQGLTFVLPGSGKTALETVGSVFLIVGLAYWAYKLFTAWRKQAAPKALMPLAFALIVWAILAKYMSDGCLYNLFLAAETLSMPLLYLTVRKAVTEI